MGSGGTTTARLKLEGIDGRAHQGWSLWLNLNQHGETYQDQMFFMTDRLWVFQDMIFGGAWQVVVRGLTCLALIQLTSEIIANYIQDTDSQCLCSNWDSLRLSRRKRVAITGP